MTDSAMLIVDTNVIIDVIGGDKQWQEWSANKMSEFPGDLIIDPIIYTELCYQAPSIEDVEATIGFLGLQYHELPMQALFLAAKAYKKYKQRGGNKSAPLPDFFIGAHAQTLGIPIITRDVARYLTYFPSVSIISP